MSFTTLRTKVRSIRRHPAGRLAIAAAIIAGASGGALAAAAPANAFLAFSSPGMTCTSSSVTAGYPQYTASYGSTGTAAWLPTLQRLLSNGQWQNYGTGYQQRWSISGYGSVGLVNETWQVPSGQIFRVYNSYAQTGYANQANFDYVKSNSYNGSSTVCHS